MRLLGVDEILHLDTDEYCQLAPGAPVMVPWQHESVYFPADALPALAPAFEAALPVFLRHGLTRVAPAHTAELAVALRAAAAAQDAAGIAPPPPLSDPALDGEAIAGLALALADWLDARSAAGDGVSLLAP